MANFDALAAHVSNELGSPGTGSFAAILGANPSKYAKSPSLWNAAFRSLAMDASYLSLDVDSEHLPPLVEELRNDPAFIGGSVTVPYKTAVMDLLDDIDPIARHIGAVNTIARGANGELIGYNTDGQGALDAITGAVGDRPLVPELAGRTALLIGAGGAAKAVAFSLASVLGDGQLLLTNRTRATADRLAAEVDAVYGNTQAVAEDDVPEAAEEIDLVVNASTRGQTGMQRVTGGVTCLEPFSALAPARSPVVPAGENPQEFYRRWLPLAADSIAENTAESLRRVTRFEGAAFFDLVYAPLETVFLMHARLHGSPTANGKWMNVAQAVDAFREQGLPRAAFVVGTPGGRAFARLLL